MLFIPPTQKKLRGFTVWPFQTSAKSAFIVWHCVIGVGRQNLTFFDNCFSHMSCLLFAEPKILPLLVELSHGALAPKKPENNHCRDSRSSTLTRLVWWQGRMRWSPHGRSGRGIEPLLDLFLTDSFDGGPRQQWTCCLQPLQSLRLVALFLAETLPSQSVHRRWTPIRTGTA